jgi:hypothetical protein
MDTVVFEMNQVDVGSLDESLIHQALDTDRKHMGNL